MVVCVNGKSWMDKKSGSMEMACWFVYVWAVLKRFCTLSAFDKIQLAALKWLYWYESGTLIQLCSISEG